LSSPTRNSCHSGKTFTGSAPRNAFQKAAARSSWCVFQYTVLIFIAVLPR